MDEASRRAKARAAVREGRLPRRPPDHTFGGPGVGVPCAVCDLPIQPEEMEYETHFIRDGDPGLDKFHVHIPCFDAWVLERDSA